MAKALDLEFRREFLAIVQAYPGLHLRELARQLGTSVALIEYHIPVLIEADLVAVEAEGYQRVYPKEIQAKNRAWIGIFREEIPTRIVLLLLQEGALRHGAISRQLELGKSKVSFHLKKLVNAGLVAKIGSEFEVQRKKLVIQLLLTHKPTSDFRDRFASLWTNFYG